MFSILVKADDAAMIPRRANPTDAGLDLMSVDDYLLQPGEQRMFDTGFAVKIPVGFTGLIFNRSSQGKVGVQIPNAVGVIDSDYRGNLRVILRNTGTSFYDVKAKETKIAQLVIVPIILPGLVEFLGSDEEWVDTKRGTDGFGSTGQ